MDLEYINKILHQKYCLEKKKIQLSNTFIGLYDVRKKLKMDIKNIDRYLQFLLNHDGNERCKIPYKDCTADTTNETRNLDFIKVLTQDIWK